MKEEGILKYVLLWSSTGTARGGRPTIGIKHVVTPLLKFEDWKMETGRIDCCWKSR
jgi:hypothetical protein